MTAWYRIALDDGTDVRMAVAPGAHLGEAIAMATARVGRGRCWPIAAAAAPAGEVPLGEAVGKGVVVEKDAPVGLPRFRWPVGVVAAIDGAGRAAGVAAGYHQRQQGETTVLEAVVAGDGARARFLDIVERLPAADNVEVRLAGHYDGTSPDEVWLTPRMRDLRRAVRFLDDFEGDLLHNGHVDVSVYVRAPRSTWRLTQHKTLVLLTDDPALAPRVAGWLDAAGLAPLAALATVAGAPHLHYRPAASSERGRLTNRLRKAGLRPVATGGPEPRATDGS